MRMCSRRIHAHESQYSAHWGVVATGVLCCSRGITRSLESIAFVAVPELHS